MNMYKSKNSFQLCRKIKKIKNSLSEHLVHKTHIKRIAERHIVAITSHSTYMKGPRFYSKTAYLETLSGSLRLLLGSKWSEFCIAQAILQTFTKK